MSIDIGVSASDKKLILIQDEVRDFFGWDIESDTESAMQLLSAVELFSIDSWTRSQRLVTLANLRRRLVLRDTKIAVLGAAVEESEVRSLLETSTLIVAADGAVGVLSSLPESISERAWSRLVCIVSDADGGDGTNAAVERSIPVILHAHGDNFESWKNLLTLASNIITPPRLVLTHQTPDKIEGMHNPGGFTDGDRSICFLVALGVPISNISLLGTRTDIVGKWSGETNPVEKLVKLQWMAKVLDIVGIKY
jgi:uncharacterized Rossmann fold enzyme|tara:strand:- start:5156 stop:5911 length:756 start_codon:yes stop_codon:yes gene_type:complete